MLYIYRRRNSTGARDLTEGILLAGTQARRTKGLALRNLQQNDAVICWGDFFAAPNGVRTLNNVAPTSKFREAQILAQAGVATVQVSQTRPRAAEARAPFAEQRINLIAGNYSVADAQAIAQRINAFVGEQTARRQAWERQPAVPAETWLPRRNNHVGARAAALLAVSLVATVRAGGGAGAHANVQHLQRGHDGGSGWIRGR